ncbi:type-F conjugative transfer system protein TraW [Parasulfuritortus cantonensis]|uniref:Type-F conjugative transfer system protein TraW n=1 Tax=Parasulfuritortus cantonensis TaxID=2528202 RepID=A0A4R1BRD7_9PROT|nr:type-F conjugative transfer system protein TraW [Parasulfuritortus cantonensis]TCJ20168.1 type-F conjugative transfer system protein TraW [Parasulfuritortus cantonensis]
MLACLRHLLILLALAGLTAPCQAVDLGLIGKTYAITEPDFLDEIQAIARQKVESGEWRRIMLDARERARQTLENPVAVEGLRTAKVNRIRRFDPSITLAEDVLDESGRVLFPAGTTVNPADIAPFPGALLLMNGREKAQQAVARRLIARWGDRLKIILVDGSPPQLMREWKRPVYFDQAGAITNRFGIENVPALVTQAGPADRFLTIEEIKP